MPRHTQAFALVAALGVSVPFMSACQGRKARDHGKPIATVGKEVIGEADFQRYLTDTCSAEELATIAHGPLIRKQALEGFLDQMAVVEKARQIGIPREQRFKKAVELGELKLLAQLLTERNRESILRNSEVPPDAVAAYYESHKHEFPVETGFSLRQILAYVQGNPAYPEQGTTDAKAKAKARKALADLRRGISWEVVAKTYSDDQGSSGKGGLVRHGQFGLFTQEVEEAVRTQPLGRPSDPIRTIFGYHVIEVVDRVVDPVPKPFEEVKPVIATRLGDQQSAKARLLFMTPFQIEFAFEVTEAGRMDTSLFDKDAFPQDTVLALIGKKPVLESEFQWFLKDAFMPSHRVSVYNRPGARQGLLWSFLDMRLLAAKARKDGLHRLPSYLEDRGRMEERLLLEFMREREKLGPFCQCGDLFKDHQAVERPRLDKVRAEVGLVLSSTTRN
jgi:hypothetical protein